MVTSRQINIENKTYYFYNDLINIKNSDSKLLKLDKKSSKNISIYYVGYVTKKPECKITSVNPLYLLVDGIDGIVEENEESKYLNISLTDSNREALKSMRKFRMEIKIKLKR